MTIRDAYSIARQKCEVDDLNGGLALDKPRFVNLFNAQQLIYLSSLIRLKGNEEIRLAQKFVVPHRSLTKSKVTNRYYAFALPSDYFRFSDVIATFSDGQCLVSDFNMYEVKNEEVNVHFNDDSHKPSFDYRETFYAILNDSILVYVDDFSVDSIQMTYYRLPKVIDISGYVKNGSNTVDINPEFENDSMERILDMVAREFSLNIENLNKYQYDTANVAAKR